MTYLPSAAVGVLVREGQRSQVRGTTVHFASAPGTIAERVLSLVGLLS